MKDDRPTLIELFMDTAFSFAKRSPCLRRKVGAVLVKDNRIIGEGYNGPPQGQKHCDELDGCLREKLKIPSGERSELCRAVHAEMNIIAYCAKNGISTKGATLYITTAPCTNCAKPIIVAGIEKVVYFGDYPDNLGLQMLKDSRIEVVKYKSPIKNYSKK
jgi:dCMP deaminase